MIEGVDVAELAGKLYRNPSGDEQDMLDDLSRARTVVRLVRKGSKKGEFEDRLILNHLVTLFNVFPPQFVVGLLRKFSGRDWWSVVNAYLVFTGRSLDLVDVDASTRERLEGGVER